VNKAYRVSLTETQTTQLQNLIKKGVLSTLCCAHAQILLLSSRGTSDTGISMATGRSIATVERTRKAYVTSGLDKLIKRKKRPGQPAKLDAAAQELMVKFIQERPPSGYARWTGKLVQNKLILLGIVSSISLSTIYRHLRVKKIKLNQRKTWCISKIDEKFVQQGKVVLETYNKAYDSSFPVICFDEKSYELQAHVREPLPVKPGKPAREDNEWKRRGTANIFMFCEPLKGWRHVKITKRRTKKDFAKCMKQLTDWFYPQATKIIVVLDNLNTHTKEAILGFFGPEEGQRICDKIEFIKTPVHGSWLNMAEIELSVLSNQCLARRIPDQKILSKETHIWNRDRNDLAVPIKWTYTVQQLDDLFEKIKQKRLALSTPQN
jgi:transposase